MIALIIIELILLLAFVVFALYFYNLVFKGQAPFIISGASTIQNITEELDNWPNKKWQNGKIYELGSGSAGFLRFMERNYSQAEFCGVEKEWLPYIISVLQLKFLRSRIKIKRKDLFEENLKSADLIYCFLNEKTMRKLEDKVKQECQRGAIIIAYLFRFPGLKAVKEIQGEKGKIYFYQI